MISMIAARMMGVRALKPFQMLSHTNIAQHGKVVEAENQDATQKFVQSIQGTIKGIQQVNYIDEHNPNLTMEEKATMKQFLVYRFNPTNPEDQPKYVSYYVDIEKTQPMYLDALLHIKDNLDSSLSLRRSCREGICGSCSMNCDGLHTLACIRAIDRDLTKPAIITPLGHMFVLKDLVVDMTNFYTQYKQIEPFLKRKNLKEENATEYYQSEDDRKKLDGLYECVLCACCSTSCPSYWWHPDRYLGPAVLMQVYMMIQQNSPIDGSLTLEMSTQMRDLNLYVCSIIINPLEGEFRLDDCQQIGMCSVTCPKNLDPQSAILQLMKLVKDFAERKTIAEAL